LGNKKILLLLPSQIGQDFRRIIELDMKKDIHPENYRMVVFKDMTNEYSFITRSAANTKETITWEDGNEYPLIKLEITHMSHPFFTGVQQFVDTAGRIDKFNNRYSKFKK
jgi:large subunit ribosomal protein L31